MKPNDGPLTTAEVKPALSYFDMNAEERLQVLLEMERQMNELKAQLINARDERDLAQRKVPLLVAQRNAAEERYVKARAENDELEQEIADLRNQDYIRQQKAHAVVPASPRLRIPYWALVAGVAGFWLLCVALIVRWFSRA